MKKIKLNRFQIIFICVICVVLVFFISTLFHTYSEYATRDASKIEGDTVYINDPASKASNRVKNTAATLKKAAKGYFCFIKEIK